MPYLGLAAQQNLQHVYRLCSEYDPARTTVTPSDASATEDPVVTSLQAFASVARGFLYMFPRFDRKIGLQVSLLHCQIAAETPKSHHPL